MIFQNIGFAPEEILRVIARGRIPPLTMPERERQKKMKRTVDRWIEAHVRVSDVAERVGPPGIKSWQLSTDQREQIEALAGDVKPLAHRDGAARAQATRALRELTRAGDRLRAAQEGAGVHPPPKVGDNVAAQRIVAGRSLEGALAALKWIKAEIDYLERYEVAIRADQAAGVINVPRRLIPEADEALLQELHRRLAVLRNLGDEIEEDPIVVAWEHDEEGFARLADALEDMDQRVREADSMKGRDESPDASLMRALALARSPYVAKLAGDLAGARSQDLVEQLVRQKLL